MSNKVFVEYKVKAAQRANMLDFLHERMRENPGLKVYEGADQPGLIVEEWEDMDESLYMEMKSERMQSDHPKWSQMHGSIEGGMEKMHIWLFRSLD